MKVRRTQLSRTRNLLEQQTPTRTEDPRDLGDGLLPLRNVVNDPKVDDGVERSGRVSNLGGVAGAERASAPTT